MKTLFSSSLVDFSFQLPGISLKEVLEAVASTRSELACLSIRQCVLIVVQFVPRPDNILRTLDSTCPLLLNINICLGSNIHFSHAVQSNTTFSNHINPSVPHVKAGAGDELCLFVFVVVGRWDTKRPPLG